MSYNQNDDLKYCLEHNKPEKFEEKDIEEIVVEVPGENDEFSWWWILKLKNGRYVLLAASCDYTGWDCQSGIDFEEITDTAEEVARLAPEKERYSERNIRVNLLRQLSGEQPKFTYQE